MICQKKHALLIYVLHFFHVVGALFGSTLALPSAPGLRKSVLKDTLYVPEPLLDVFRVAIGWPRRTQDLPRESTAAKRRLQDAQEAAKRPPNLPLTRPRRRRDLPQHALKHWFHTSKTGCSRWRVTAAVGVALRYYSFAVLSFFLLRCHSAALF